jgi:hypothetical protein
MKARDPQDPRGDRDARGPNDERDERDGREPGDPRDVRDPREHEPTSNRTLLTGFEVLAVVVLLLIALTTVMFIRIENGAASQSQLQRLDADSCHVFQFVDERFTIPTKTESATQKQITAAFAGYLNQTVSDCTRAGYTTPTSKGG